LHRTIPSIRRFAALKDTTTISLEDFVTDFFGKWRYGDLLLMVQVNDRDNDLLYIVATALFTRLKQIREAPPELEDSAMALLRDFLQTKLALAGFRRPPSAQSAVLPPDFLSRKRLKAWCLNWHL